MVCKKNKPKVSVVTLKAAPVALTTELPGRTVAVRTAQVRPQVNGLIDKRLFIEGSEVEAGKQLYQIDPALYEAELSTARAARLRRACAGPWRSRSRPCAPRR